MKIIAEGSDRKLKGLVIEHKGSTINTTGCGFDRTVFPNLDEIFMDINMYWETLPSERQDEIWGIYKKIFNAIEISADDGLLCDTVQTLVTELYNCWDHDDLSRFVRTNCNVHVPDKINRDMGDYQSVSRTYVYSDYRDLICLVVALRPMIPIWSEFIRAIEGTSGKDFKDYRACALLNYSVLVKTPAYIKLSEYIGENVDTDKISMSTIVRGVGSSNMEAWVRGSIIIRKVAVGVILHYRDYTRTRLITEGYDANIVSNVYRQIGTIVKGQDKDFKTRIRDKNRDSEFHDEDKESNAEKILVKQSISDDKFVIASTYARNVELMRRKLDDTIPEGSVKSCIESIYRRPIQNIADYDEANRNFFNTAQITLTQWAVNKVINARSIPTLEHDARNNVIGLAQALYWHWGFHDIACLLTATPISDDSDYDSMVTARVCTKVTTEQFKTLSEQYPYYRQDNQNRKKGVVQQRSENVALKAIDLVVGMLEGKPYKLNAPKPLIKQITMEPYTYGGYLIPPTLKVQLANFIIKLNNYNKAQKNANR